SGTPATVTVAAGYTKNGEPATLPLPSDLADDLHAYVASLPPGRPIFPLAPDCGAKMLRPDLDRAGIPYVDAGGLVFDFHALRCQMATLADAAGVTPRVVQRLMRHSTLELTGRYTRPRAVDIEHAAESLPSLRPNADKPESLVMTGTDPAPVSVAIATPTATQHEREEPNPFGRDVVTATERRSHNPQVWGSSPSPFNIGELSRTMQACHRRESLRYLGKRKWGSLMPACPLLPSSSVNSHNPYNTQSDDIQLTLVTIICHT